jgi:hypothetical protein
MQNAQAQCAGALTKLWQHKQALIHATLTMHPQTIPIKLELSVAVIISHYILVSLSHRARKLRLLDGTIVVEQSAENFVIEVNLFAYIQGLITRFDRVLAILLQPVEVLHKLDFSNLRNLVLWFGSWLLGAVQDTAEIAKPHDRNKWCLFLGVIISCCLSSRPELYLKRTAIKLANLCLVYHGLDPLTVFECSVQVGESRHGPLFTH